MIRRVLVALVLIVALALIGHCQRAHAEAVTLNWHHDARPAAWRIVWNPYAHKRVMVWDRSKPDPALWLNLRSGRRSLLGAVAMKEMRAYSLPLSGTTRYVALVGAAPWAKDSTMTVNVTRPCVVWTQAVTAAGSYTNASQKDTLR